MAFSVVCISRTLAAGGEAVGRAVAQRLGYRFVDEEIIGKAAQKAQVDPAVVAAAEHKQPLLKRLIDSLGMVQGMPDPLTLSMGVPLEVYYQPNLSPAPTLPDDLRGLIRDTIAEVAGEGNAVIVAHAASMALAGAPGVLRVLVTASPQTRARRLVESAQAANEKDAAAMVAASDRERGEYFRRFYSIKEETPTHYDLVINTDVLAPEQAVSMIVRAALS
jgi:cytidylate kinase